MFHKSPITLSPFTNSQSLNCIAIFNPCHCVRQDRISGKMIGFAKERNGLYYLENTNPFPQQNFVSTAQCPQLSTVSAAKTVSRNGVNIAWLEHCRRGHPPFSLMKSMFPSLFTNVDFNNLHCVSCELAKHHRVSFPIVNKISDTPFSLIHTDVWGPSKIPKC